MFEVGGESVRERRGEGVFGGVSAVSSVGARARKELGAREFERRLRVLVGEPAVGQHAHVKTVVEPKVGVEEALTKVERPPRFIRRPREVQPHQLAKRSVREQPLPKFDALPY